MSYAFTIAAFGAIAGPLINSAIKTCLKSCRKTHRKQDSHDNQIVDVATRAIKNNTTTNGLKKDSITHCYVTPILLPPPVLLPAPIEQLDLGCSEESPTPTYENYVSDDEVETEQKERTLGSIFDELPVQDEEFQLPNEFMQKSEKRTKVAVQTTHTARILRNHDMVLRSKKLVKFNGAIFYQKTPYFPPACRLKSNAR